MSNQLKDIPEDEWRNLRDAFAADGIELDPETTVEEAVALAQAKEEDMRELGTLQLRVADKMKEVERLLELYVVPEMRAHAQKLPFDKLIYFVKPVEQQRRIEQLNREIDQDLITLNHRDPKQRAALLQRGLDLNQAWLPRRR